MTISEFTAQTGVTESTLRYYEKIGVLPAVPRDAGGKRAYSEDYFENVQLVQCLKASGMPLAWIRDYISLTAQGERTLDARRTILLATRQMVMKKLAAFKNAVQLLDGQLADCGN